MLLNFNKFIQYGQTQKKGTIITKTTKIGEAKLTKERFENVD